MAVLAATTVKRGGRTRRRWYETIDDAVNVSPAGGIRLRFSMSSGGRGGGYTDVEMEIRPADFPTLVETMCLVDRHAAMQAMSDELRRQISTQPERDVKSIADAKRQAADDIQELARKKYFAKPRGQDERERIVLDSVQELVAERKRTLSLQEKLALKKALRGV